VNEAANQAGQVANRKSVETYALGYGSVEHDRLIRQAVRIDRITERLLRDAGVGIGQRVLDLGSGLGDVSMLLARIVGPSGEVVGIDRDGESVAVATHRVRSVGLRNVRFIQGDASQPEMKGSFDVVAGRFILMFLPDPAAALRAAARCLHPGGLVVFQEPSWDVVLHFNRRFALYSAALQAIHLTLQRAGVRSEQGPQLRRVFREAGLPAPSLHAEMPLGCDSDFISVIVDLTLSIGPLARQHGVSMDVLGDLGTLASRIQAELEAADGVASLGALVGAWSRT
jgi:ubiquinone/menaquinone biosynthesis C-methylase UbiE